MPTRAEPTLPAVPEPVSAPVRTLVTVRVSPSGSLSRPEEVAPLSTTPLAAVTLREASSVTAPASSAATGAGLVTVRVKVWVTEPPWPSLAVTTMA